jgi:hypothetical protein
MNPIDDQISRLFRAAARAAAETPAPPFGLDTRVMAAWRASRPGEAAFWDMSLLVRGLIVAIVLMGISFWPVLNKTTDPFAEYVQLADSTLVADNAP